MNEKANHKRMMDKVRSGYSNSKMIKVVYLGLRYGGFKYGTVLEAEARHASKSGLPYPFPKWSHYDYRITDVDGDYYTVSENGKEFVRDWYPVSEDLKVGDKL